MNRLDWVRHLEHASGEAVSLDRPLPVGALGRSGRGAADRDGLAWALTQGTVEQDWSDQVDPGEGPLRAWGQERPIEVWTEEELAAIHGLWRLARRNRDSTLQERLRAAARWHLHHTQPDNATHRPWAVHVFLLEGSDEGRVYAETLLHNATALRVRLETVSAWILGDAAAELRALAWDR